MNKTEYIQNNKYLRKGMQKLNNDDLEFLKQIQEGKIDINSVDTKLRFKQLVYHMQEGFNLWELRGLYKAFKVLNSLPD